MILTTEEKQRICLKCPHRRNYLCKKHGDEWKRVCVRRDTCEGWGNEALPEPHTGDLAAVTCYFNPCGYESIRRNYFEFREQLQGVDLFIIELSFTGEFVIPGAMQVTGSPDNVMWQKERLLNLLVETLPEKYTSIAWIDADVIFEDPNWAKMAQKKLSKLPVVQLFETVDLTDSRGNVYESYPCEVKYRQSSERGGSYKPGYAWAARRDLFPLFDKNIMGGGDSFMMHAWLGTHSVYRNWITPAHQRAYREWAAKQYRNVQGNVGYLPVTIRHLWHGTRENRQYVERAKNLTDHGFDPATDISIDSNGLWYWSSDKPEMHRRVAGYFENRKDDDPSPVRTGSYPPIKNMAIVSCHFNPCGYRRPVENCRRFLDEIGHPVTLVELSFDGQFQFDSAIQIRGDIKRNFMWQKERLLNIGIQSLPDDVDAVAWIDVDLLFQNRNWFEDTKRLLERHQVVQLFQYIDYLGPDRSSVIRKFHSWAEKTRLGLQEYGPPGGALAARMDAIPYGLPESDILGSSDTQFVASLTASNTWIEKQFASMKRPSQEFAEWKRRQLSIIDSDLGVVPGKILHLWHGDRKNRGYDSRIGILKRNDFNSDDITIDENGLWAWNTNKPNLHREVAEYFTNRKEDGETEHSNLRPQICQR